MNRKGFLKSLIAAVVLAPAVCRMAKEEIRPSWKMSDEQIELEIQRIAYEFKLKFEKFSTEYFEQRRASLMWMKYPKDQFQSPGVIR